MTINDLAMAMHVPLSTAKSRLYAGMEQIKLMVGKEAEEIADFID